jgi:hypothetical protein
MRGFPKHINTAQDFKNLLNMPEFKKEAEAALKEVRDLKDSKITKATTQKDKNDSESEWNTIEVDNPFPKWKQLKFKSKKELTDLISSVEAI